jgi:hypothetical protein
VFFSGDAIRTRGTRGEQVTDASFLFMLNASDNRVDVTVPAAPYPTGYAMEIDTSETLGPGTPVAIPPQTVLVLRALDT